MKEISFNIIKTIGIISYKKNWSKELNIISWNGKERKFDLRNWSENHSKMSKGITLTKDELINLKELLNKVSIDEICTEEKNDLDNEIDDIFDEL